MEKICSNCGATMPENKRFCTECGAAFESSVRRNEDYRSELPRESSRRSRFDSDSDRGASPGSYERSAYSEASPRRYRSDSSRPSSSRYRQPYPENRMQEPPAPNNRPSSPRRKRKPAVVIPDSIKNSPYEPISTGGYIGIFLLSAIPILGLILLIFWACGKCQKLSKRNLSRAMLILMAIMAIISLILTFTARSFVKGVINQAGLGQTTSYASGDSDNSSLGELSNLIEDVEALGVDMSGIGGLIDGVSAMNNDMESANSGWPSSLRAYPAGSATALTSYRTQISGTTLEEMHSYINALKGDGFAFKDFYDFGLSESDMLSANGWWGTDGKLYLSMTWSDNTLVIDHTTTLPDLSSYF